VEEEVSRKGAKVAEKALECSGKYRGGTFVGRGSRRLARFDMLRDGLAPSDDRC
jgi:hypothetical protein